MAKSKLATLPLDKAANEHGYDVEEENLARQAMDQNIDVSEKLSAIGLLNIVRVARMMADTIQKGRKIMLFGNGGSAADAEHFAAELVGRFRRVRRPLKAMALTANTSILTALGNDFGFEEIYSRQVKAFADQGDVVVALSTSGRSRDVLRGVEEARRCGATTVGLTGSIGGELSTMCDYVVQIPSEDVQRIQECHILVAHIVCDLIERSVVERE